MAKLVARPSSVTTRKRLRTNRRLDEALVIVYFGEAKALIRGKIPSWRSDRPVHGGNRRCSVNKFYQGEGLPGAPVDSPDR